MKLTLLLAVASLAAGNVASRDWSQFRGPNGSGVARECSPPIEIAADAPAWRTSLPPGKSSPILWGDRIFLTALQDGRLVTLAFDAKSGRLLWKRLAPEVELEKVHAGNSPAASTPCADAERVYVYFGSYGLLCYDHEGREQWAKALPTPKNMYGIATSPILYEDELILLVDDDANLPDSKLSRSKLLALDKATGELIWQTPRPYNRGAWSTPMTWESTEGTDLVVLGNGRVYGYDPVTGEERWYVRGFAREPIAVPVADEHLLYVSVAMQGGRGDEALDPEPFWQAMLYFDRNGDGQIGRDEITEHFTWPFRPELPPDHPGFGMPLPADPEKRRESQNKIFDWRDKNKDGRWTKEEFSSEMRVGRGRPNLKAIRPGGSGDVTETHVSWELHRGVPEIPSPVLYQGRLYVVRDGGILSCVNVATGEVIYRERLPAPGQYSASPVVANNHVYLISGRGVVSVVKCGDEFEVVHTTDLGAEVAATPAVDADTLYIRTANALLAFR